LLCALVGRWSIAALVAYTSLFRSFEDEPGRVLLHAHRAVGRGEGEGVGTRRRLLDTETVRLVAPVHHDDHRLAFQRAAEREEVRSEEHTSELQSRENLVCRLLLEK